MQKEKSTLRTLLQILLFLAVLILAIIYCNSQHVFSVKHINVRGNYELDDKEIIRISGIKRGSEMFSLKLSDAIQRLNNEAYIHNAIVSRQFPDCINIYVIERRPLALIDLKESYALDPFGTVLPLPRKTPKRILPRIQGIDPNLAMVIGEKTLHLDILYVISFINYIHSLSEEIAPYCNHIRWSDAEGWIIRPGLDYPSIYLGKEYLQERIDILHAFVHKMQENEVDMRRYRYINLQYKDQVIVREKL